MKKISVLVCLCVLGMAFDAFAMTAPATGDKFYTVYDLVVNDVIQGPIGYAIAVIAGTFTASMAVMSKIWPAAGGFIGTALMIAAPQLVESMGALII